MNETATLLPFGIAEAMQSLLSQTCPHCGGLKLQKKSLCRTCYFRLPGGMQNNLYRDIQQGYVEHLNKARVWLAENPPAPPRQRRNQREAVE